MSRQLRFRRLELKNWKNFQDVDVPVQDRIFLVGANASGKSNLLDAFRFLRDLARPDGGFRPAVLDSRRGGVKGIRCLAARRQSDIEISVGLVEHNGKADWRYELVFHQDKQRRPQIRRERVVRCGATLVDRPNEEDKKDPERLTQTYLEQVNVNQPFRELNEFFRSIRYLHLVPQLVRDPDRSVGHIDDPYGGDLLEQVAKTSDRTQKARLKKIRKALRVAVPQLETVEVVRGDSGRPHLRGKYQHWRPQGAWQTEAQFSDGTLRLLGLLWAVMDTGGPLLLEEPELSLHPEIVRVLPQMLARAQRLSGRQIFVSTHSPELLSDEGIGLDEAMLLRPDAEGTAVEPAGELEQVGELLAGGLSLADVALPRTRPENARQITLFAES